LLSHAAKARRFQDSSVRILLVGDYPNDPRLGSAKVPHKLAQEFRALGHSCDLLFAEDLGSIPRRMHPRHLLGPFLAERAVARAFARHGHYDVVDVASAEGLMLGLRQRLGAYPGTALVCRSNGLEHLNYRRMLDDHTAGLMHKPWARRLWYPLVRLNQVAAAARLCDRLLVLSEVDREFAVGRGWKKRQHVAVIGHGVSARFLEQAVPTDASRGGGILFCGTWTGVKGVDYLVPAFTQLIDSGAPVNLTILGPAIPEQAVRAAFPTHVRRYLKIVDRVPENEVIAHYRRHDLLVFCSTYEGFGMVLLEAMTQGLPVVATPVGCAARLVQPGQTGLLVPARDSAALADAMGRLLANPGLRRRMAENAFAVVRTMSWTDTALKTLAIYSEIKTERGEGAARSSGGCHPDTPSPEEGALCATATGFWDRLTAGA
jgi:glycosyltransferase involved in cell wall biosynthesis